MSDEEADVLEGLYRLIAEDWKQLQYLRKAVSETLDRLRSRIAQALLFDAAGRAISRETGIPEATVRRLAAQAPSEQAAASETVGAA